MIISYDMYDIYMIYQPFEQLDSLYLESKLIAFEVQGAKIMVLTGGFIRYTPATLSYFPI